MRSLSPNNKMLWRKFFVELLLGSRRRAMRNIAASLLNCEQCDVTIFNTAQYTGHTHFILQFDWLLSVVCNKTQALSRSQSVSYIRTVVLAMQSFFFLLHYSLLFLRNNRYFTRKAMRDDCHRLVPIVSWKIFTLVNTCRYQTVM